MNEKLSNLKCKACSGKTKSLSDEEIYKNLKKINGWTLNNDKVMIFKKFNFKNFKNSLNFVNNIGNLSEEEGHHPDISLGWGYCLVMIHTHAINALTINDFILASKIDLINIEY